MYSRSLNLLSSSSSSSSITLMVKSSTTTTTSSRASRIFVSLETYVRNIMLLSDHTCRLQEIFLLSATLILKTIYIPFSLDEISLEFYELDSSSMLEDFCLQHPSVSIVVKQGTCILHE